MYIRDYMTTTLITVEPTDSVGDALELLKEHSIRRLPVLSRGNLVGLVTETDLLKASPSPATSLSIHEINYLFPKIQIKDIMTKKLITISPDAAIEEAAVIMRENKLGTLLVVEQDALVGLITESDLFKVFIDVFGFERPGVRITVTLDDQVGELGKVASLIGSLGIFIITIVVNHVDEGKANIVMRLKTDQRETVIHELEKQGYQVAG